MNNLKLLKIFVISAGFIFSIISNVYSSNINNYTPLIPVVIQQVALDANNINAWVLNTGIFNTDNRGTGAPGFEWPKFSGQFAIFSTGLTIAANINSNLLMAAASYSGEYAPGYIITVQGVPVAQTDSRFKIYSVRPDEPTSYDWLHWGDMVPYGAPFNDINHNGIYDPLVDIPGVPNASQTIFVCLTDGFPSEHNAAEGFGGGTSPLFAEVHLVAWSFNTTGQQDVDYFKWTVINRNTLPWTGTYFSIVCDPDLGCPNDDYIGCDTTGAYLNNPRDLGFCWNGEYVDCSYPYKYTGVVPAVGITLLESAINKNVTPPVKLHMTSFDYFSCSVCGVPICETDPNPGALLAYHYMQGTKKDASPWVVPPGGDSAHVTKFCYSGDPETGLGWCEADGTQSGSVQNCGGPGHYSGTVIPTNPFGDRRFVMNSGANNLTINPGDTQKLAIAQMIARGSDRKNSVTVLKQLCTSVRNSYLIGIKPISNEIPTHFMVYQNYPNPFNPSTNIKYEISKNTLVKLSVYDILGKEIAVLVNEKQEPGTYKVEWDASNYPSGVYFYSITATGFTETRKMVLVK
jgi:hypothetical protein